jgi:uncharacterized protein (TIGR00369 family)
VGAREDRIADIRARVGRSRFHGWMGMGVRALGDGTSVIELGVEEHHTNLMGVLHGGVITSLADAATGIAMLTALDDGWSHLTTSLQMTFLSPGRLGETVVARGRVVKRGRRFGYAEADVEREGDGTLLARAAATFMIQPEGPSEAEPGGASSRPADRPQ